MSPRNIFGGLAFLVAGVIVGFTLSPFVAVEKEEIALIVLGNVLSWPVIVLQFFFGSSDGSKEKSAALMTRPSGVPGDEVHVEEG